RPERTDTLREWGAQNAQHRNRLRQAIAGLQQANALLEQQLEQLLRPPHHVARLLACAPAQRIAWIAPTPTTRVEVRVHEDVDAASLRPGADVVLTAANNCILRVLPRGTASGSGRVLTLRGFVDDMPHGTLLPALAADGGNEQLVWVEPELAARLRAAALDGRRSTRVCVDEHGLALALCRDDVADPLAAAARF